MAQQIEITDVRDNKKYVLLTPNDEVLKQACAEIREVQEMNEEYKAGVITGINVRECQRRDEDKTKFNMIDITVASDGRTYKKSYSVDFLRKYLVQLGIKAENTFNAAVMFKPKDKFKNIGYLAFIGVDSDTKFVTIPFVDGADQDVLKKLKELGL